MRKYADFDVCTLQALRYVSAALGVSLDEAEERALLEAYLHLPAFADVREGLPLLKRAGYSLVALTNGTLRSARSVLENAGIGEYFAVLAVATDKTWSGGDTINELPADAAYSKVKIVKRN